MKTSLSFIIPAFNHIKPDEHKSKQIRIRFAIMIRVEGASPYVLLRKSIFAVHVLREVTMVLDFTLHVPTLEPSKGTFLAYLPQAQTGRHRRIHCLSATEQ